MLQVQQGLGGGAARKHLSHDSSQREEAGGGGAVIGSLALISLFHTSTVPMSASERVISDSFPSLKPSRVAFKAPPPRTPSQQPLLPTSKTNDALNLEDASIIQTNHPPHDVAV